VRVIGVDRSSRHPREEVEGKAGRAAQRAERGTNEDDGKRLPGDRHRGKGSGIETCAAAATRPVPARTSMVSARKPIRGKTASRRVAASDFTTRAPVARAAVKIAARLDCARRDYR
jgi:hypothetical protein